jgi:hypothetical protein
MGCGSVWEMLSTIQKFVDEPNPHQFWRFESNRIWYGYPPEGKPLEELREPVRNKIINLLNNSPVCDIVSEYSEAQRPLVASEIFKTCKAARQHWGQAEVDKKKWLEDYAALYRQLQALDQLFIAV